MLAIPFVVNKGLLVEVRSIITLYCVSRSENRSCTGFEPHHCRSQNRTAAAPLTALVPVQNRRQRTVH